MASVPAPLRLSPVGLTFWLLVIATAYSVAHTGLNFGYADSLACRASDGRPRVYNTWQRPDTWPRLREQIGGGIVYGTLKALPALAAILLSRSWRVSILLATVPMLSLPLIANNMTTKWHQCDRKGCSRCDEIELLLLLAIFISIVALSVSYRRRAQQHSGTVHDQLR